MVHAPWGQLHIDISDLIFERLDLEDRIRFNLVCKQWSKNTKQTPQPLWLMLPYGPSDKYLSFFDICDGKVVKLNLPEFVQGGWFCGCSKGWLLLSLGRTLRMRIFLFDQITRVQIPFPSLSTISSFEDCLTTERCRSEWNPAAYIICEVEPSSFDVSQCIVAATLCDNDRTLALCKPGDERWTIVKGLLAEGYCFGSIIFFDGELYVSIASLDEENNNNQALFQIHSITIGNQRVNLKLICSTTPPRFLFYAEEADGTLLYHKDCERSSCLVESNGQLLMVTQTWDAISNGIEEKEEESLLVYIQAATFQVFKIQKTTEDAVCSTRLTDLGDLSLLLGIGVALHGKISISSIRIAFTSYKCLIIETIKHVHMFVVKLVFITSTMEASSDVSPAFKLKTALTCIGFHQISNLFRFNGDIVSTLLVFNLFFFSLSFQ